MRPENLKKLNPNKTYYVVTNDFTANKGDGYDMFGGQREEGISLDEVVGNYIQKHNLNKYNTNNPERIINGKLDSVKKSTHKSDNGKQSSNHTHKKSA